MGQGSSDPMAIASQGAASTALPSDMLMGAPIMTPGAAPGSIGSPDTGGQSTLDAMASGVNQLGKVTSFLGDNKEEIMKNAKALSALVKDIGSAHQTMLDSTLMRRMIQHGMAAPLAVFGGATAQGAGRIQPTFNPSAMGDQWRGMR